MILIRETTPIAIRRLTVAAGREHPVDAEQHARVALFGVDVDVRGALLDRLGDDRVHQLDDRRVAVGLVGQHVGFGLGLGLLVDDVLDRLVHPRQPRQQQVQILDRRATAT